MTTATPAKKDIQKLQRVIVDGLEDVKAQDIKVFDTEHLSALFERVIVASGTSNRQTKALAASVSDAVREAGFPKPRLEGQANGEWIIVDCGQAVVHVMQPIIRQYYNLEELWGEKAVRLKFGAAKPLVKAESAPKKEEAAKPAGSLKRSNAAKKGVQEAFPSKAQVKKNLVTAQGVTKRQASKAAAKPVAKTGVPKPAARTVVVNEPAKKMPAKKVPAKKVPSRAVAAKKAPVRQAAAKTAMKPVARKTATRKA
ncbi:MAG: ribosome silencing factor [Burkholderiales bacterium]|nr:ribosome silencing factor [Burkholderiales bacterium]